MDNGPIYIVWRRSPDHCHRIWFPQHFRAEGITPPSPSDPDVVYHGDNYAEAFAAANQANAKKWPIEQLRTLHGLPPAKQPPTPIETPSKANQHQFQESLFG